MAQLGGIPETGMGVGLAQVFQPTEYKVPDIAGALQKRMALADKRKEAEAKQKEKEEKKGKADYFHPIDYIEKEEGKRIAAEFRERHEKDPVSADEWLKGETLKLAELKNNKADYEKLVTEKGKSLATQPAAEIEGLDKLKILENGSDLYEVYKSSNYDPYTFFGTTAKMATEIRTIPKPQKKVDWRELKVGKPEVSVVGKTVETAKGVTETTTTEKTSPKQAESDFEIYWRKNDDYTKTMIRDADLVLSNNPQYQQAAPDEQAMMLKNKAKEIFVNFHTGGKSRYEEKPTKESGAGGGRGALTEKDIISNYKYTSFIPREGKSIEQEAPFALVLSANEVLNIPAGSDIIDRTTGTGMKDVDKQLNISGGVILPAPIKKAGQDKMIYDLQLFATATDNDGTKYDVQIPLSKIENTIKRHDKALTSLKEKAAELNRGGKSEKKWTYQGVTLPESEWLKAGWTIEKLKKHAK